MHSSFLKAMLDARRILMTWQPVLSIEKFQLFADIMLSLFAVVTDAQVHSDIKFAGTGSSHRCKQTADCNVVLQSMEVLLSRELISIFPLCQCLSGVSQHTNLPTPM